MTNRENEKRRKIKYKEKYFQKVKRLIASSLLKEGHGYILFLMIPRSFIRKNPLISYLHSDGRQNLYIIWTFSKECTWPCIHL